MWFHYQQNNSGGRFILDEDKGITHHVFINADNTDEANDHALSIGLYWNGDIDCPCCGDRWYPAWEGMREPLIYGEPVRNYTGHAWMKTGRETVLHHADGSLEWIGVVTNK